MCLCTGVLKPRTAVHTSVPRTPWYWAQPASSLTHTQWLARLIFSVWEHNSRSEPQVTAWFHSIFPKSRHATFLLPTKVGSKLIHLSSPFLICHFVDGPLIPSNLVSLLSHLLLVVQNSLSYLLDVCITSLETAKTKSGRTLLYLSVCVLADAYPTYRYFGKGQGRVWVHNRTHSESKTVRQSVSELHCLSVFLLQFVFSC